MIERAIPVYGILALLVLGMAEASTLEELLDELGTFPGINVTQVNETSYLLTINVDEYSECVGTSCNTWFPGNCNPNPPYGDCKKDGTCCPNNCKSCAFVGGSSLCCVKGCSQGPYTWCC